MTKKAFVFAAGMGTRLAPLTDDRPKALVKLNGKPLLWHVSKKLIAEGFDDITINVHHFAQQIIDYVKSNEYIELFNGKAIKINISDESDCLLDTGGGLRHASPILFDNSDLPVLLHNVDICSNARLGELYDAIGQEDALLLVSSRKTTRYLLFNEDMRLVGWTDIRTGEIRSPFQKIDVKGLKMLAFSGIHVVCKHLVEHMQNWPSKFGIMDFYINQCKDLHIYGIEQNGLQLTDVGKIETLQKLQYSL